MSKRIFKSMFCLAFLIICLFLCSCDNAYDENEVKNDELIDHILCRNGKSGEYGGMLPSHSLKYFYDQVSNEKNVSIMEGKTSSDGQIICGYVNEETSKTLEETIVGLLDCTSYPDGIDKRLKALQTLIYHSVGFANEKIYLYSFKDGKIPYKYDNKELLFVYESIPFVLNGGKVSHIYMPVEGKLENEYYITESNETSNCIKNRKFIILSNTVKDYIYIGQFYSRAIELEDYFGKESLWEEGSMFYSSENGDEYFDLVKESILSEEKELKQNQRYHYDYLQIKQLFNIQ